MRENSRKQAHMQTCIYNPDTCDGICTTCSCRGAGEEAGGGTRTGSPVLHKWEFVGENVRTTWWNLGGNCALLRAKKDSIGFSPAASASGFFAALHVRFAWPREQRGPMLIDIVMRVFVDTQSRTAIECTACDEQRTIGSAVFLQWQCNRKSSFV
jgi:hypothetical protein